MARIFKSTYSTVNADGKRVQRETGKWYSEFADLRGRVRRCALATDADVSRRALTSLTDAITQTRAYQPVAPDDLPPMVRKAFFKVLRDAGHKAASVEAVTEPIEKHIRDYETYLRAKRGGVAAHHRKQTLARLRKCLSAGAFVTLADITQTPVDEFLNRITEDQIVNDEVRRGCGPRTRNTYKASIHAFTRWCVESHRLAADPLAGLTLANEDKDIRRKRRAMTDAEFDRLLRVAELRPLAERGRNTRRKETVTLDNIEALVAKARDRLRLKPSVIADLERTGRERRLLYRTFVMTGLRRGEMAGLLWSALQLEGGAPTLTVAASTAKNGKVADLPLRADHVTAIKAWRAECDDPSPMAVVFPHVPQGLIHRFKRDLAAAGIPFRDDAGRQLDIHALRHTTATHLARANVPPRVAMQILRHSKIEMTMAVYTDPRLLDMAGALEALPGGVQSVVKRKAEKAG